MHFYLIPMNNVLQGLDCMKRMESELVVDNGVVVSQLPTPPMISATHKCVEELLDINKDHLMLYKINILVLTVVMLMVSV